MNAYTLKQLLTSLGLILTTTTSITFPLCASDTNGAKRDIATTSNLAKIAVDPALQTDTNNGQMQFSPALNACDTQRLLYLQTGIVPSIDYNHEATSVAAGKRPAQEEDNVGNDAGLQVSLLNGGNKLSDFEVNVLRRPYASRAERAWGPICDNIPVYNFGALRRSFEEKKGFVQLLRKISNKLPLKPMDALMSMLQKDYLETLMHLPDSHDPKHTIRNACNLLLGNTKYRSTLVDCSSLPIEINMHIMKNLGGQYLVTLSRLPQDIDPSGKTKKSCISLIADQATFIFTALGESGVRDNVGKSLLYITAYMVNFHNINTYGPDYYRLLHTYKLLESGVPRSWMNCDDILFDAIVHSNKDQLGRFLAWGANAVDLNRTLWEAYDNSLRVAMLLNAFRNNLPLCNNPHGLMSLSLSQLKYALQKTPEEQSIIIECLSSDTSYSVLWNLYKELSHENRAFIRTQCECDLSISPVNLILCWLVELKILALQEF